MAKTDIAGLLTGVPSGGIDPMMGGNIAQQRLAFGAQQAQGLQRAARGLMGQSRGTPAEQLQMAMAQLDLTDPADLRKLASIQQATGRFAEAAKTAATVQQLSQEENTRQSLLRIARAQGNDEMVDFLLSNGDLRTAASVLFARTPAAKASTLTSTEEEEYTLYWDDLTKEQQKATGLIKESWMPFGFGDAPKGSDLKKLFIAAEAIYTNNPELGRKGALMQVLNPSSTAAATIQGVADTTARQVQQGDQFSYMKED